ncbi:MAG: cytochrome c biogenesis protein CcsA [bacterium]|nr:cytochrome c biogenesis protein CcsA [bacterium]
MPAAIAGAVLTTLGFLMAFLWAAPVNGAAVNGFEMIGGTVVTHQQLISQKIFYFHMPSAIVSFLALIMAAIYGIRFLTTREQRFDTCSRALMEIALLFVAMTMITGDLWTRFEWGVWWTWEPRLTTYLILMLIVIAYFVLRNAVDEPERRATFASVVSIIALVDVPICFLVTRLIPSSVHPVVLREGGMSSDMALTVLVVVVGMLCLGHALYRLRFRALRLRERLEALKEILDERQLEGLSSYTALESNRTDGNPSPNEGQVDSR